MTPSGIVSFGNSNTYAWPDPCELPRPMANEEKKAAAGGNGNATKPTLNVLAQYVKDLSFESPGAPQSLRSRDKAPGIAINVIAIAMGSSECSISLVVASADADRSVQCLHDLIVS